RRGGLLAQAVQRDVAAERDPRGSELEMTEAPSPSDTRCQGADRGGKWINLVLSASDWFCCDKHQSNRNVGIRLEGGARFEPSGFVPALLLMVITSPVAARSQQPTPVAINRTVQEAAEKCLSSTTRRARC